ncbi:MAG: hypothetical protein AB7O56_15505 [Bauldia sp.]
MTLLRPALLILGAGLLASCTSADLDTPPPEPPAGQPFFVGEWAADAAGCDDPWVITTTELVTPGEVACTFDAVTQTATGYSVAAQCTAEAPPAPYTLRMSYAQSAQALLIEGAPFEPIGLVACR